MSVSMKYFSEKSWPFIKMDIFFVHFLKPNLLLKNILESLNNILKLLKENHNILYLKQLKEHQTTLIYPNLASHFYNLLFFFLYHYNLHVEPLLMELLNTIYGPIVN